MSDGAHAEHVLTSVNVRSLGEPWHRTANPLICRDRSGGYDVPRKIKKRAKGRATMSGINYWAVAVSALAGFVAASVFYSIFAAQLQTVSAAAAEARPPVWKMLVELMREFVVALVFAGIANEIGVDNVGSSLLLALALFAGFPLVLWTGAILWEKTPWKLAALHGGDWLFKLLLIGAIVGVWR